MLLVDFPIELQYGDNIVRYREVESSDWYYLHMDIETLNLLIQNYGLISTVRTPTGFTNCDNPTTGAEICVKYAGVDIVMVCKGPYNEGYKALRYIEQDY